MDSRRRIRSQIPVDWTVYFYTSDRSEKARPTETEITSHSTLDFLTLWTATALEADFAAFKISRAMMAKTWTCIAASMTSLSQWNIQKRCEDSLIGKSRLIKTLPFLPSQVSILNNRGYNTAGSWALHRKRWWPKPRTEQLYFLPPHLHGDPENESDFKHINQSLDLLTTSTPYSGVRSLQHNGVRLGNQGKVQVFLGAKTELFL